MAQNTSNWAVVISAVGQLITWVLVVVSWAVVNRQHNRRETRKELRAQLDQLKESLSSLEQIAEQYHSGASHDEGTARRIKLLLQRITNGVDQLGLLDDLTRQVKIISLRRAITYRNFDSSAYRPEPLTGELIASINASVDELVSVMETSFRTMFPVS